MVSGILISEVVFPNIHIGSEPWFKMSHISISFLTLVIVGIHVGLHWQWVVNVTKKITRFQSSKRLTGILAKAAAIALLLFGGYQAYTTQFASRLIGVSSVFHLSSGQMPPAGVKLRPDFARRGADGENTAGRHGDTTAGGTAAEMET